MINTGDIIYYDFSEKEMVDVLKVIYEIYGFDMTLYAKASLRRRFIRIMKLNKMKHIYELKNALANQYISYQYLIDELTVNVTDMFRDPPFFKTLKNEIIPYLSTFSRFKIWHAGCSSGEEMYSLAILLREAGLQDRVIQYGTDINSHVLTQAKNGVFNMANAKVFTKSYQLSGGNQSFSNYYTAKYGKIKLDPTLRENMVFANHNLVHEASFGIFELIICRNVLIYFNQELQERVLNLFKDSLRHKGYLALGSHEGMGFKFRSDHFNTINKKSKLFRLK